MGFAGSGKANRLAEIIAATCIAGEASTVAAIVSGEFVAAHEALGRNRPE
jgi:hydroxymethylglutaryl-CoA reductase (NADPH)